MSHLIGIPDEQFIRDKVPMTKQEVRIISLAKAQIRQNDVVIDIGAGTGSLSVEAALLAPEGKVFAIEREEDGVDLIRANAGKFGADNLAVVTGSAPAALNGLPAADVIFVGGSGGHLKAILDTASEMLKPGGRLVINAVTVETLHNALGIMQQKIDFKVEACGVQITRIKKLGASNMLQALNPVYVIACIKGEAHERNW